VRRKVLDRNELMASAWHGALWARVKALPKLKDVLAEVPGASRPAVPTWQQQQARMLAWADAMNDKHRN
jgi:hypothetical protein